MHKSSISVCYFPTTTLLIDDNAKFLQNLSFVLKSQDVVSKTYDNPLLALDLLQEEYASLPAVHKCISHPEEEHLDNRLTNVDIRQIHRQLYNAKRFVEISVIVIDYVMPEMDGLIFCEKIKNSPIRKILLTGEADHQVAIEAFNKGLIQQFIRKDDPNISVVVAEAIKEQQRLYFQELSEPIVSSMVHNPEHEPCALGDALFIEMFNELLKKHKVVEYYLLEGQGSFLFLDKKAKPNWLFVSNAEHLRGMYQIALYGDYGFSQKTLKDLEKNKYVMYKHYGEPSMTTAEIWQQHFHVATKLESKNTFYFAFVKGKSVYDIEPDKILSYAKFLG